MQNILNVRVNNEAGRWPQLMGVRRGGGGGEGGYSLFISRDAWDTHMFHPANSSSTSVKETPRRRIMVMSSLIMKYPWISSENRMVVRGRGAPPTDPMNHFL